jgi:hypothetical protein
MPLCSPLLTPDNSLRSNMTVCSRVRRQSGSTSDSPLCSGPVIHYTPRKERSGGLPSQDREAKNMPHRLAPQVAACYTGITTTTTIFPIAQPTRGEYHTKRVGGCKGQCLLLVPYLVLHCACAMSDAGVRETLEVSGVLRKSCSNIHEGSSGDQK